MTQAPSPDQPSDQVRPDAGSQARSEARPVRLRPALDGVPTYRPGKPPTPVEGVTHFKLSSNENPYPPLPSVLDAIADAASHVHRYPDPGVHGLRERIAAELGVGPDEIVVGPGSAAVYDQIVQALVDDGDEVVYSWRSFELYPICVAARGGRSVQVPNTAEGRHDLPAMARSIRRDTRLVIVCSPNNPTGTRYAEDTLREICANVDGLVLLDEAYREFCDQDLVPLLDQYDNIVLFRTFSKALAMAGLRVGYCITRPDLAREIGKVKLPYALNIVSEAVTLAALDRPDLFAPTIEMARRERRRMSDALAAMPGVHVYPSAANFVLARFDAGAANVFDRLLAHSILVRDVSHYPGLANHLRISIGTPAENDALLAALRDTHGS